MPSKESDEAKVGGKGYPLKEALHGNIMTVEALINVLAAKGVLEPRRGDEGDQAVAGGGGETQQLMTKVVVVLAQPGTYRGR